mmetsp:Transcript_21803/g.66182  ORF Transcript_21803/g.66182 Transcript_21803/m.66182 type:complete len:362 (-) Transcript_21803:536-1621(-)
MEAVDDQVHSPAVVCRLGDIPLAGRAQRGRLALLRQVAGLECADGRDAARDVGVRPAGRGHGPGAARPGGDSNVPAADGEHARQRRGGGRRAAADGLSSVERAVARELPSLCPIEGLPAAGRAAHRIAGRGAQEGGRRHLEPIHGAAGLRGVDPLVCVCRARHARLHRHLRHGHAWQPDVLRQRRVLPRHRVRAHRGSGSQLPLLAGPTDGATVRRRHSGHASPRRRLPREDHQLPQVGRALREPADDASGARLERCVPLLHRRAVRGDARHQPQVAPRQARQAYQAASGHPRGVEQGGSRSCAQARGDGGGDADGAHREADKRTRGQHRRSRQPGLARLGLFRGEPQGDAATHWCCGEGS